MVTQGSLTLWGKNPGEEWSLGQGESAFIPAGIAARGLFLGGTYTLYAAGTGEAIRATAGFP